MWAKVECEGTAYGKGYWKLNNDILLEQEYRANFRGIFQHWVELKCLYVDRGSWWEEMKKRIKKFSIEYSMRRAQASKKVFKVLQREIAKEEGDRNRNRHRDRSEKLNVLFKKTRGFFPKESED